MADSKGIENALAAILAKMETLSEEIKDSNMSRQKFWEEMNADREEWMAKLQEMSADIEVDLTVENSVPCDNFEVPNVLVEHTLNESNINEATHLGHSISLFDMVEYLDYAFHYSEDNESEISSSNTISPEHTCLLYTSRCV